MAYGVTATGFVDKPIETSLEEIEDSQKAEFGSEFDVSAQSPAGQLNGGFVLHVRELWEVLQAIYNAWDPDVNTGVAQSQVASITGTIRESAEESTVTATVNLDAGITLPAGAVASVVGSPASRFVTLADATNGGGAPADVSVAMEAEEAGVVVANAGTLTEIETPQSGWNTITNALDAEVGTETETEEDLRVRREEELQRAGAAAVDAIRADVLAVDDVTSVTVFENDTDLTDGDGVPPHSVEVLVLGGTANDIAQAIWGSVAGGIQAYGSSSGTAVDENGDNQTVYFSRPSEVPLYVDLFVDVDADYPVDGDAQISAAVALWSQENIGTGDDLILSQLHTPTFSIAGVVDLTLIEAGIAPAPGGTANIVLGSRELGTIDSTDVVVTS